MEPLDEVMKNNEIFKTKKAMKANEYETMTSKPTNCKCCGKPYKKIEVDIDYLNWYIPVCGCFEKLKEKERQDKLNSVETKKCEFCGKEYKKFLSDENVKQEPDCNCIEERQELEHRIEQSLMTPLLREKTFDKLEQTKEVIYCRKYADEFNPETSKGIAMIGNIGTGKTTLLAAICNELISKGYKCLFITFSELLEEFSKYSTETFGDISYKLERLKEFDFIVFDDFGRAKYTDKKEEITFRIVDRLLNYKLVTCISANPEMLKKTHDNEALQAVLDRLKDICPNELQFKGESLRGKNNAL